MARPNYRNLRRAFASILLGGTSFGILGFVESCDDRLLSVAEQFDPCGTILANCAPGQLTVNRAEVGDYCVDPACTVPGQCGGGQALGTITRLCP